MKDIVIMVLLALVFCDVILPLETWRYFTAVVLFWLTWIAGNNAE